MVRASLRCATFLVLTLTGSMVSAHEVGPDVLLKAVTAELLTIVKQNRGHLNAAKTNQLNELLERKVVPLFDFGRMTETALARNWLVATPEQRNALTTEFRTLLVRTYCTALRTYRDHNIDFKPLDVVPAATNVTVKSVIRRGGAERMTIDYEMDRTPTGWKIYAIHVDGVNLIANFRETFIAKVRASGIDGLIKALAEKNSQSNYSGFGAPQAVAPENPA